MLSHNSHGSQLMGTSQLMGATLQMIRNLRVPTPQMISMQRDPETGEEPDVVEFYRKMRWNERKGWIAPQAKENYAKMVEIRSQSIEEGDKELAGTEILERVLGKRSGYVMGLGHGEVPPSRKSRVAHNEEELNQLRSRTIEQDQELNELHAWKASQEELSKSQQQMIEAQAKKQETDRLLNALKQKFGL